MLVYYNLGRHWVNLLFFKIVDTLSDIMPLKVVFKDANYKDLINVEERFKWLSPETKVVVV